MRTKILVVGLFFFYLLVFNVAETYVLYHIAYNYIDVDFLSVQGCLYEGKPRL